MSDGPFKNLRLSKHWKKFAKAAYNDAFDLSECHALVSHAIVQDILTDPVRALFLVLKSRLAQRQTEMDPLSLIDRIFAEYSKGQFVDILQKEMVYCVSVDSTFSNEIFKQALTSALDEQINISRAHFQDECILIHEIGGMKKGQLDRTIDRSVMVFDSLDRKGICDAIFACNKDVFKKATAKKNGLDEGPSL